MYAYAKWALTPWSLNMKFGPRRMGGRVAQIKKVVVLMAYFLLSDH